MSLSAQYKTDSEKETKGVRVVKGLTDDGKEIAFFLSYAGRANKRYTKLLDSLSKPHQRALQLETIKPEIAERISMEAFVGGCVNGWENVPKSDITGNAEDEGYAEYNKANAIALFTRLPHLYEDLSADSKRVALFREEEREEEAKN